MAKTAKKTTKKNPKSKKTKTLKATAKTSKETKKASTAKKKPVISREELISMIEKRAYELYLERGGAHGDDQGDWYRAEREILQKYSVNN